MPNTVVELVRIRERNEITLPRKARAFLGVQVGHYLEFEQQPNGSVVVRLHPINNSNENYQPPSGEESTNGGNGDGKTLPAMDKERGGISGN